MKLKMKKAGLDSTEQGTSRICLYHFIKNQNHELKKMTVSMFMAATTRKQYFELWDATVTSDLLSKSCPFCGIKVVKEETRKDK